MRKLMILTLFALALPITADAKSTRAFVGLFEGVDPGEGSLTQRQIVCDDRLTCLVLGADQFFSACTAAGGRGILEGEGELQGGVLDVPDFTLSCADGTSVSSDATFSLEFDNQILIEDTVNPNIPTIRFHRINTPLAEPFEGRRHRRY